jgi:hypothetical protein
MAQALTETCERIDRDPGELRRSLLLGYGTVRTITNVAAYQDAIAHAEDLGFDELVVYGPSARQATGSGPTSLSMPRCRPRVVDAHAWVSCILISRDFTG